MQLPILDKAVRASTMSEGIVAKLLAGGTATREDYERNTFKERNVYWVGDLMYDCHRGDRAAIEARGAAWRDYLDGKVELIQRRITRHLWAYLAIPRENIVPVDWHGGMTGLTPEENIKRLRVRRARHH